MAFNNIVSQINNINNAREDGLKHLGNKVRTTIIMPVCREYNLQFRVFNSGWAFFKNNSIYYIDNSDQNMARTLHSVIRLLETNVGGKSLGQYVGEILI